mmetsp:Transcript_29441/g.84628  ORF Transcript_29441/g.84628 Transcript_29441/m.84628 type:complete len:255 (+) Transcript_29441:978-1742(+)
MQRSNLSTHPSNSESPVPLLVLREALVAAPRSLSQNRLTSWVLLPPLRCQRHLAMRSQNANNTAGHAASAPSCKDEAANAKLRASKPPSAAARSHSASSRMAQAASSRRALTPAEENGDNKLFNESASSAHDSEGSVGGTAPRIPGDDARSNNFDSPFGSSDINSTRTLSCDVDGVFLEAAPTAARSTEDLKDCTTDDLLRSLDNVAGQSFRMASNDVVPILLNLLFWLFTTSSTTEASCKATATFKRTGTSRG